MFFVSFQLFSYNVILRKSKKKSTFCHFDGKKYVNQLNVSHTGFTGFLQTDNAA